MRLWYRICGTFIAAFFLLNGACALFEYFPGESIGLTMFTQLSGTVGTVQTGVSSILVGLIFLFWVLLLRQHEQRMGRPKASLLKTDLGAVHIVGSNVSGRRRPLRLPSLPQPISVISIVWAIYIFVIALYIGIAVITGPIPGLNSGIDWIEKPAQFLAGMSERLGPTLTGSGVIVAGTLFAIACLYSRSSTGAEW